MVQPAQTQNPLNKYFRQPSIYVKLPSEGKFWPKDAIDIPVTGELPVYPLTTRDEVILKTPDALMNGSGVVDVIHSCCPSIKNAWAMPSVDVDSILIAIRIASYGHSMDFTTKCPHCNAENTYDKDLRDCLAAIHMPNYEEPLYTQDLEIMIKPQAFFTSNKMNQINFEEQKMLKAVEDVNLDPELRNTEIYNSMQRLIEIGLDNLTASTEFISPHEGGEVRDPKFIRDFYANADSATVKLIQEKISELSSKAGIPPFTVGCAECSKPYDVPVEFNYTNFFGSGF